MDKEPRRMFKRVNVFGLDFYVDWLDVDNVCVKLISVKDVHGGRSFVYADLKKNGVPVEDILLEAVGVKKQSEEIAQSKEEVQAEATAAQETEQPKEEINAKTTKKRNKRSKE